MLFDTIRAYAALLRETKRIAEADPLEKRAKAVIFLGEARPLPKAPLAKKKSR
jgi:hypothetical protein